MPNRQLKFVPEGQIHNNQHWSRKGLAPNRHLILPKPTKTYTCVYSFAVCAMLTLAFNMVVTFYEKSFPISCYICVCLSVCLCGEARSSRVTSHALRRLISPTIRLYVRKLVQANNKETFKALHYWPFVQRIPRTRGQNYGRCVPVMTCLWTEWRGIEWVISHDKLSVLKRFNGSNVWILSSPIVKYIYSKCDKM